MANFGKPTKYEKPNAEAANPFLEPIKTYTDMGVDTAFPVEFARADYSREKLQIQKAANAHGFSVREVETNEADGHDAIRSTFVVRPRRKGKTDDAPAEQTEPAEKAG